MRSYLLIFLVVIIAGCKNTASDKNSTSKVVNIKQLEADYQKSKTDSLAVQLIYAYGHEISNAQNKEDKLNYLKKVLTLVRKSDYDEFRKVFLMELIKTDPQGTADELLELGNFYEDEENTNLQSIIFLGFKNRFPKDPRNKDYAHKIFLQLGDHRMYFKNLLFTLRICGAQKPLSPYTFSPFSKIIYNPVFDGDRHSIRSSDSKIAKPSGSVLRVPVK